MWCNNRKCGLHAYYDGYDTDGDGRYRDYHYNRHRSATDTDMDPRDHVGTDFVAPYAVTWDTELVPDQDPGSIKLVARIRDTNGVYFVTPEVTGLSLQRTLHAVYLCKPMNVPESFWVRDGQTKSSQFVVPAGALSDPVSAKLLVKTWNGIDGGTEPGETNFRQINSYFLPPYGANHFYQYDVVDVPTGELVEGLNTFTVNSTTIHHGIEMMWPGPAVLVRTNLPASPPAAPTGLTASMPGAGLVMLDWNDHPETAVSGFDVYRGMSPGFVLDASTRIASDVGPSEFLVTGLPESTTFYFVVTAIHVAGIESVGSTEVMATTIADSTAPSLVFATTQVATQIVCGFDEALDPATANDAGNYNVTGGAAVTVLNAVLAGDQTTVTLTTTSLAQGVAYTLSAIGVRDLAAAGNASNTSVAFEFSGGLLAHYPCNEGSGVSAIDVQGGGSAALVGAGWTAISGDGSSAALDCDGVDDYVLLGNPTVAGSELALALWCNIDDFDVGDGRLLSKAVDVNEDDHYWMVSTIFTEGQHRLRLRLKTGGVTTTLVASSGALVTGVWTHVVATYDGLTMRLYKDGVLVGSRQKSGALDAGAGVPIAVGNQPPGAGARAFDGAIDDIRIYERVLTFNEIQALAQSGITADGSGPVIDLWYGSNLRFGHLGNPQNFANVLGNVSDSDGIVSLSYRFNGGPAVPMGIGPDMRRLQNAGDFNVDLPFSALSVLPAMNTVEITAEDTVGNSATSIVDVDYDNSVSWPGSYTVDWDSAAELQDVCQVVDGSWGVQGGRVITLEIGYDRLLALGEVTHADYTVTVPVTVHSVNLNRFTAISGGPLVGLGLRWEGHTDAALDPGFFGPGPDQPEWGFFPAGGFCWYRWTDALDPTVGIFQIRQNFFGGSSTTAESFSLGQQYVFKARITTNPDGSPRVRFKRWRPGIESEPAAWLLDLSGAVGDPVAGGLLLIAHHVDAEFGDVVVTAGP